MSAFLLRQSKGSAPVFPLSISADARYFVDARGRPRPILGRTSWHIVSLPAAAYQAYLQDTIAKGFNAIEMNAIFHWPATHVPGSPTPPYGGNGALPFLKRLDGADWTGALTYTTIANECPDFTTPNEVYFGHLDQIINYAASQGILLAMFIAYHGYDATNQGWQAEKVANGQTRMQTWGAWCANRWRNAANLLWMLGGDKGTAPHTFTTNETNAEQGLITGLQSIVGRSTHYGAEWESESIGTDQTSFGSTQTVNGAYSWTGATATQGRRGYADSPTKPAFYMEGPYDQEGPESLNYNPNAVQPVRRFNWQGWLSTIGGYITGNGYVWPFGSTYQDHLNTAGAQHCAILNAFITSIEWWRLVPSGLGSIGTLITAGGGTIDTTTYVAAAATPLGDLFVAYIGPGHTGSVTVDNTKMRGTYTASWVDPTTGTYTSIGTFPNTGTQAFTPSGNNAAGDGDWVLRLDA